MHNCKLTRNTFIDLTFDEMPPASARQLLAELNDCPTCRDEYEALRSTLHVSHQALRSAQPGEEFWPGYRARLQSKLLARRAQLEGTAELASSTAPSVGAHLWLVVRSMAATSVRVPVPAALALLLVAPVSFFIVRSHLKVKAAPSAPVVFAEPKTVQVPVIQEKVITRVVYIEKKARRSGRGKNQSDPTAIPGGMNSVAESYLSNKTTLSLVDFKPTDEVKLTIIKGSYKDQNR